MPGRKPLSRLQFGKEATPGTLVAATARMRFNGGYLSDDRTPELVEEAIGILGGADRNVIVAVDASLDIPETPATPEQLPYLLAMLYGGPVTGAADGTGSSGYRYATPIPTTSAPANTAYTVEGGDDYEVERMGYTKCTRLTIKGTSKGKVTMSGSAIAQYVERLSGGFASTSIASVNDLVFGLSRLFLDAVDGTIGTTQIEDQYKGFEITFEGMWEKQFTGEGNTANGPIWTFVVFADKKVTGKLTLLHDPAVDGNSGLMSVFRTLPSVPTRLMRIDCLGAAYGTAGSGTLFTGGRKGIRIDLPITVTKVSPLSDESKVMVRTVEFESRYNATYGSAGSITVANEISALP